MEFSFYEVTIREVLEKRVEILATSKEAAELQAEKMYASEEVVLDSSDFSHVEYEVAESEDKKDE